MIYRGTYFSKNFQFTTRSDGQPVDVTGWQLEADMKDETDTVVLAMSTGGGHFTVIDASNGMIRWSLTVAQTQGLAAGPVGFALYRTDAIEGRKRLFRVSEQVRNQD
jgi:hypothetical protein